MKQLRQIAEERTEWSTVAGGTQSSEPPDRGGAPGSMKAIIVLIVALTSLAAILVAGTLLLSALGVIDGTDASPFS